MYVMVNRDIHNWTTNIAGDIALASVPHRRNILGRSEDLFEAGEIRSLKAEGYVVRKYRIITRRLNN